MSESCAATGIWGHVESQFGHPQGLLGRLVGTLMALEHKGQADWVVELLGVERRDRVLEIGFGPGLAIQRIADIAREGFVAGVDISEVMVQQASRRNAAAIREGRVRLSEGSATALPYQDGSFDKALAINTLHHVQDPAAGLRELWRVLKPRGVLAIAENSHWSSQEEAQNDAQALAKRLSSAGFDQVTISYWKGTPGTRFCVLGVK